MKFEFSAYAKWKTQEIKYEYFIYKLEPSFGGRDGRCNGCPVWFL